MTSERPCDEIYIVVVPFVKSRRNEQAKAKAIISSCFPLSMVKKSLKAPAWRTTDPDVRRRVLNRQSYCTMRL